MKNSTHNRNKGTRAEQVYINDSAMSKHFLRKSTKDEDMKDHIDVWLKDKQDNEISIDVKTCNKRPDSIRFESVRRWHAHYFSNKYGGRENIPAHEKLGWGFGKAKFIAYQVGTTNVFEHWDRAYLASMVDMNQHWYTYQGDEGSQVVYIPRDELNENFSYTK
tara:strand:- start:35 stop:523 length:489 start_codon:yes stop_codon:yes gene_type:complete